ncbi:Rrf2 family transcriptional regulator [Aquamicrobium zhengzhouense]|uniref:Rrf2 family transcriptional regulator n=1 Tax=Aquamicrobium zhengzhouense TaxID=2781738 RepID=A0ABS0SH06_9HYPH|nr:Rrf2 family transcriptional regulator [Aquamicrobium zhengzhouense]MBI1622589.1 Rrf2 family transcriptional regulator [Aquamicrobium zhengzhouense]
MRMTLHTDYALRMLIYVAMRPDGCCTVHDVAETYGLSRNHLLKVAQTLNKLGYIMTVRGRTGGIRLARSPAQINVGALVRAVEEDFSLVECLQQSGGACVISPACMLKSMFSEALTAYLSVLDKYTLADAVRNRTALATLLGVTPIAA